MPAPAHSSRAETWSGTRIPERKNKSSQGIGDWSRGPIRNYRHHIFGSANWDHLRRICRPLDVLGPRVLSTRLRRRSSSSFSSYPSVSPPSFGWCLPRASAAAALLRAGENSSRAVPTPDSRWRKRENSINVTSEFITRKY